MLHDTSLVLNKHPDIEQETLRGAAALLMAKQFIYRWESTGKQRTCYLLIKDHLEYYKSLFDAIGNKLVIDDDYGYIGLIPESHFRTIKLVESLFLLVARLVYEEEMMNMQSSNDLVRMSYESFLLRYESLTGRERPENNSKFNESISLLMRFGVIKLKNASVQGDDSEIRIYPGIMALINKGTLEQIKELNGLDASEIEETEHKDDEITSDEVSA